MMTEIDIWRAAYLMLWWYGETAQAESARRADEFAADRDPAGEACWRRIIYGTADLFAISVEFVRLWGSARLGRADVATGEFF